MGEVFSMVPLAVIAHKTAHRLRIRIASRRGESSYFAATEDKLREAFADLSVTGNALTGTILLTGKPLDVDAVVDFGRSKKLFAIQTIPANGPSMARSVAAPLHSVNRRIQQVTSGRVDLPGAVFIALLGFGVVELIRGNWRTPPWYTALWYAFGLYSKSFIDQSVDIDAMDPDGD
jgi:hypothetical protein